MKLDNSDVTKHFHAPDPKSNSKRLN